MTTDPSYQDSVQRTESPPRSSNEPVPAPATAAATATGSANAGGISTAPSYSPIYTAAQPAGMVGPAATGLPGLAGGSLPEGEPGAGSGSGNGVFTPSETTNPTPTPAPSTTRSSVSGARSEVLAQGQSQGYALGQGQSQGQGGVPPPPKTGEPVMPSGFYQPASASAPGPGPGPVFRGSTTGVQGYGGYSYSQGQGLGQGYGYGYGQGYPNSTSAPYSSVYHESSVSDGDAESGFLDVAKGWMQTAGDKLVQVEAEVWRRINDAHGR